MTIRDRLLALVARVGFIRSRQRLDDDAGRELELHLELLTERFIRAGMSPAEAGAAARRQLGNVTLVREEIRRMNTIGWIDAIAHDLRSAVRQLRHSPGVSAVVIATLALGIGGTTAIFSVVDAVLLAPLPYDRPGELVRLHQQEPGNPASRHRGVSAPHFRTLRDSAASFADIAARQARTDVEVDLVGGGTAERLRVLQVTSEYFRALRPGALRGPGLSRDDEVGTRRVVLSDRIWRTRFAADASLVGRTVRLSAEPYEVVGIAPSGFEDPLVSDVDAWVPYDLAGDTYTENYGLVIFARLQPTLTLERARSELARLSETMATRWPEVDLSQLVAEPLHDEVVAPSRGLVRLLAVSVALVLLIACVNVASLILVRASGRRQEFAVRAALGSGRGRLVRQVLFETLLLAALGGMCGLGIAAAGVRLLQKIGREALPRIEDVRFDPVLLGVTAAITVITALACGVLPALRLARVEAADTLRQQSRSTTASRRQTLVGSGLAVTQVALALALLTGAGALLTSAYRLQQVDLGIRLARVLTFDVHLPAARYAAAARAGFHEDLAQRLEALPGVVAVGATSRLPATGTFHSWPVTIQTGPRTGTSLPPPEQPEHRVVTARYFEAFGIPLLAGRTFDDRDVVSAPFRAVVSARFAQLAFPGLPVEQIAGQRIRVLNRTGQREIVGVVGDVSLDAFGTPAGAVYTAHRQFAANRNWALTQVVWTERDPWALLDDVRAVVAAIDPELVVHRAAPMTEVVGRSSSRSRFALVLMGAFAAVALALASLGLYGVLAHNVRRRTQEIGIRLALGATAGSVRALVLRQAATIIAIGSVLGGAGAIALGRSLSTLLFGISPTDPLLLLTTAMVLAGAGLGAAWLPAQRAARVNPRRTIAE